MERLGYKFGTDKSRDDHNYVDLCEHRESQASRSHTVFLSHRVVR